MIGRATLLLLLLTAGCTTEIMITAWRPGDTCARPQHIDRPSRCWTHDVPCDGSEDVIATLDSCCEYFDEAGYPDSPRWCDDVELLDP